MSFSEAVCTECPKSFALLFNVHKWSKEMVETSAKLHVSASPLDGVEKHRYELLEHFEREPTRLCSALMRASTRPSQFRSFR